MRRGSILFLTLTLAALSTAAFAQEPKPAENNHSHALYLQTDSGRYGVRADALDPRQLGVEIYPGARIRTTENDGKGANLSLDWGPDSTHLYVQKYVTPDSTDKVLSFYRKQLSKFGAVLECRDGKAVATVASELKCDSDSKNIELKAGTAKKLHVVGVTPNREGTEFDLVYLEQTKPGEL